MKAWPFDIGKTHFVGIGGIGMSGIAEVMHNLGYNVQGSDAAESANVQRLRDLGVPISVGQSPENVSDARVVVASSAIQADNPEIVEAKNRHIPVIRRAEMLAELMRLKWCVAIGGTHGKTTTTSLVASILDAASMDPTVINGGIINAYGTNARKGEGDWMVVEADESDGTFLRLPAALAVVTNIDPEHLDHYGSFENEKQAFQTFVENVPFYGAAIMCMDHPEVQSLIAQVPDRRIVTYGQNPQADLRVENVSYCEDSASFDVVIGNQREGAPQTWRSISLPMPGLHNVENCLAAIAVALEMNISEQVVRSALAEFKGVKRRFTKTGVSKGITIIDDYGHHPVEISAVLAAARQASGNNVVAVVQPHRYSRLHDLFDEFCNCFNDADTVIVTPVYTAGEDPIADINHLSLAEGIRAHGHKHVVAIEDLDAMAEAVAQYAVAGDMVVCLGAGNITQWAQSLPNDLKAQSRISNANG